MDQPETAFKIEELVKGTKVLIIANRHRYEDHYILGTISETPKTWTKIMVRYFTSSGGDQDQNGNSEGEWVIKDFNQTHLEKPTKKTCLDFAKHYKRLALEFNEMYKSF